MSQYQNTFEVKYTSTLHIRAKKIIAEIENLLPHIPAKKAQALVENIRLFQAEEDRIINSSPKVIQRIEFLQGCTITAMIGKRKAPWQIRKGDRATLVDFTAHGPVAETEDISHARIQLFFKEEGKTYRVYRVLSAAENK